MPTTVHTYTGDGVLTDFTISFSFLDASYVTFKVEDTALADVTSNYTGSMFDANTFRFTVPIPSGFRVTFTRDTQLTDDLFSFATGAVIRPNDLGDSMKTLRDYTEEKHDQTANVNINIASDAVTSATSIATTKASEASASETAAASSASAASTSASNAATSETNASTSETNAAASATASATSATNAGTSETNAATSASNASTSETNAAASETAAATSATNAATSATNAATSETAAEAARDVVRDVILGQFADDAAVDTYLSGVSYTKDTGDLYFNTTDSRMKVYTGSSWVDIANTATSDAAATSAIAAQTAQTAAEAALSSFNNKWHGEHASDTAVNSAISGDAALTLEEGDLYYNSTDNKLKVYNGSAWQNAASVNVINTSTLDAVGDVSPYNSLTQNDFLVRGAGSWENQNPASARGSLGLGAVASSNDYNDLTNLPTLGTAAAAAASDFATATQGALAGSAVQPADLSTVATSGSYSDLSNLPTLGTAAAAATGDFATAAQGSKADSAVQPNAAADFGANDLLADHIYATGDGTNNGKLDLQCSAGTHAVTLEGPDHSGAYSYTVKLPQSAPAAGQTLQQNSANDQLVWATPASGGGALVTDMTDITLTAAMNEALTIFSPATSSSVQTQTFTIPSGKTALYVYAVGKGGDGGDVYIDSTTGYYGWGMPGQPGGTGCTRIALNDTELAGQNLTLRIDSAGNAEVLLPNAANTVICRGSAGIDYIDVLGNINPITNTQSPNPTQTQVLAISGSTNSYLAPKANQSILARWYQSVGGDLRYNGVSSGVGWEARTTVKTTNLAINNYYGWGMSFEGDIQTTEVRDGYHRYWTWRPGSNALISSYTVEDGTLLSRAPMATQPLSEFAFDRFVEPGVYLAQVQQDPDAINSVSNHYSGRHSTAPLPGLIADSNYHTYMLPAQVSSGYNNIYYPQQAWNGFSSDPIDNNSRLLLNAPDRTAAQIGHGGMGGFAGHNGASIDSSAKGLGGAGGPAGIFILAV